MLTFGALSFTAPWLLLGLMALPVLWWLLRVSPPSPHKIPFPALRILLGLNREEQTPARMPLWLLLLRLFLVACLLIALAGPLWNAIDRSERSGPLVLVVDTGWAAAPGWRLREATLSSLIDEAERKGRMVLMLPTATARAVSADLGSAADARAQVTGLRPQPFAPDRAGLLSRIGEIDALLQQADGEAEVVWLSDGLDYGAAPRFAEALGGLGSLTVLRDPDALRLKAIAPPENDGTAIAVPVLRPRPAPARTARGQVRMLSADGRVLATAPYAFEPEAWQAKARFDLPIEVRNRAARLEIAGAGSAGGVFLLDGSWRRRPVGLVSGSGTAEERPLLSDLYYLRRALDPYADLRDGPIDALLASGLSVLILSDVGQIVGGDRDSVAEWVENGGVLIRFAGPRLAQRSDDLIPVDLRRGGRALGGTLSWETPQGLGTFDENGPFADLTTTDEIVIHRQVLAQPAPDLDSRTWARLADGTPLVTADRRGRGWIVLVHVTANQEWSTLPLSGVYVEMLRRLIALSPGIATAETVALQSALPPVRVLDGAGRLTLPGPAVQPMGPEHWDEAPNGRHPPGLYGREGAQRAYNLASAGLFLVAMPDFSGIAQQAAYLESAVLDLRPWLLILAFLLVLADLAATLWITGQLNAVSALKPLKRTVTSLTILSLAALCAFAPGEALAASDQDKLALEATRATHLAYVITGDAESDALTRQGLASLSRVLASRTAFEPAEPVGVDPERDELVFYPLVYWRMTGNQPDLSPAALRRIDTFMKNGGTILFDTADQGDGIPGLEAAGISTAQGRLREILRALDIPPLEPVPQGHVLRKAFYLLSEFPGRSAGGQVWVEATQGGGIDDPVLRAPSRHDGVSSIIIGGNDWAAVWARDEGQRPLVAAVPGGERQRELAYRFGVNLVMYTLSGNYKADQVHVPAILERLGQ